MFRHLSLIDNEWVKEMIISQNQRLGYHKRDFLESRIDELINHYGMKDAGKRSELLYRTISNSTPKISMCKTFYIAKP